MKTIREKTKKAILFAISTVAALSLGAGVGSITASAANDTTKLESLTTGGASVRVKGEAGIRFQSTMDDTDYQDLTAENSGFETGVIAIPADLLDNLNDLTLDNPNVANGVTTGEWLDREDGEEGKEAYAYFTALEMTEENYTRNIAFRSYYTINGATGYGNVLTRSLTYVANAAANDTTDEGKAKYEENKTTIDSYIKDYTVKYVNGVTEEVIDYKGVTESEPTAEEAALFGGEFKAWTTLGAAWDETAKNAITGDTVVKSNYTASETLDFTQATEVPTHLVTAIKNYKNSPYQNPTLTMKDGELYCVSHGRSGDKFQVHFLETLRLEQGEKIVVSMRAVAYNDSTKWMNVFANSEKDTLNETEIVNSAIGYLADINDPQTETGDYNIYRTFVYEVGEGGMTLNNLNFALTDDGCNATYYIEKIEIQEKNVLTEEEIMEVDFTTMTNFPSDYSNKSMRYHNEEKVLFVEGSASDPVKFKYPNIQLAAYDKIMIVLSIANNGFNLRLNGDSTTVTYNAVTNGAYVNLCYTVPAGSSLELNSIDLCAYNDNASAIYKIKSIIISKATAVSDYYNIDMANYTTPPANLYLLKNTYAEMVYDETCQKNVLKVQSMRDMPFRFDYSALTLTEGAKIEVVIRVEKGASSGAGMYINPTSPNKQGSGYYAGGLSEEYTTVSYTVGKNNESELTLNSIAFWDWNGSAVYTYYIQSITITQA